MSKPLLFLFSILILTFYTDYSYPQIASLEATLKFNKINNISVPYQNGMPIPTFEKQSRWIIDLSGEWKKQRFAATDNITLAKRDAAGMTQLLNEAAGRHTSAYDDAAWQTKILPAVENQMNPYPSVPEYYEDGVWYRRKFSAPDSLSGRFFKLIFYSVNYVADVWLNDEYLGYHEGGFTPFAFDVSAAIKFNEENTLVVRVDNPKWGSRNDIVPFYQVDWFNYTGIIHDVYLEVSDPLSVIRANIVPQNIDGTIQTTVVLYNKSASDKTAEVSIEIFEAEINPENIKSEYAEDIIGTSASFSGEGETPVTVIKDSAQVWRTVLKVSNPKLWSPKDPNLYVMKVTLKEGEKILDEYFTQFGIRTIRTQEYRVYLNEQPIFLTGVARHEDHPVYGRSIPTDIIFTDLEKVKGVNANLLRTGHYPNHLFTYLAADRLGIVINEEIPVWWFDDSLSWMIQNSVRHIHEQMFKEMVFKDYNRPSVMFWSAANECRDVTNRKTFIQRLKLEMGTNYPDGRLLTQSAAADRPGPEDESQSICDVAGWTMYFGVFHGSTYYDGTRYFLGYANIAFPEKPIMATEFGYWSGETGGSQGTQVTVFNETFKAFKIRAAMKADGLLSWGGYLMAVTWWCIFDWYSHQQPHGFQSMGLYDMHRSTPKEVMPVLKAAYEPYFKHGGIPTTVNDDEAVPDNFELMQNFPNPFNPSTKIAFKIPERAFVTIKIFDILGREAAVLVNSEMEAGSHKIDFSGDDLSSGIYIYKIYANGYTFSRKMLLLK